MLYYCELITQSNNIEIQIESIHYEIEIIGNYSKIKVIHKIKNKLQENSNITLSSSNCNESVIFEFSCDLFFIL